MNKILILARKLQLIGFKLQKTFNFYLIWIKSYRIFIKKSPRQTIVHLKKNVKKILKSRNT